MDGIIFDVDGTLWNSTDAVAKAWTKAIQENSDLDLIVDAPLLNRIFGKTMDEICDIVFPMLPLKERTHLGDLCFEYENQLLAKEPCPVFDGVVETFQKLSKKHKLFIVSNCACGYIEVMLSTSGLDKYVTDTLCFGQTNTSKGKTIRTLMERNNLKDVVYVGDTQGDADACKEADVPFIFAEYGFGNVPDAKTRIKDITDLTALF